MYYKNTQDTLPDKSGNYLWRPTFVRTNTVIDVKQIAKLIAGATTLTVPDIVAVLLSLPEYMNIFLKEGHTVRLDGLGTFYLHGYSTGNGVENEKDITANQFNRIVCRFNPEYTINRNGGRTRALGNDIELVHIDKLLKKGEGSGNGNNQGGNDGGGGYEQDPNA